MKSFFSICVFFLAVIFVLREAPVHADATIQIAAPDLSTIEKCSTPPASAKPISLLGVELKTPEKAVGTVRQGDHAEYIYASDDLKSRVGDAVVGTLKKCGYRFSLTGSTIKLRIDIDEFSGGAKNKMLVGKGETRVAISLIFFSPEEASQQTVRFDRSSTMKGFSSKKLKRLEKTLNAAVLDIMKSLAASPDIAPAVADLSKLEM